MSIMDFFRDSEDLDEQDKRVKKVLGNPEADVTEETLNKYFLHLNSKVIQPCELTGMQNFAWEEPYVLGGRNKKEYEQLKKTHPSYTDKYDLLQILNPDECDNDSYGLLVKVCRVSDKKQFILPLSDLETTDKVSINHQLFDDYSYWFVNN